MDSTDAVTTPPQSLETARVVPIAELRPDLPDLTATAVGGVVTITWPYNKVKGTFAFSLAEPNFCLRRRKGQVRISFTGRAAEVVGGCGLGSHDEVLVSLAGAAWETEASNKRRSLPGADLGWRLLFSDRLLLKVTRAETGETDLVVVDVDERPPNQQHEIAPDPTSVQPPSIATEPPPSPPPAAFSPITTSPVREINRKRFNDGEFASPAFVKRARMSYGSLFEDGFDIFQEDTGAEGNRRKRTRFGRDSSAWRYTSRSPSPEPSTAAAAASPEKAEEHEEHKEHVSSPSRRASSPTKVQMTDEGCQTMELDRSWPQQLASAPFTTHADMTVLDHQSPMDDVAFDAPTEAVVEQTQVSPPLDDVLPETRAQDASTPDHGEVPGPEVNAALPYSDQRASPPRNSFVDNPWNVDVAPSFLERQQQQEQQQQHKTTLLPLNADASLAPPGFETIASGNQLIPFDESDSVNKSHIGDGENQDSSHDGIISSIELHPPAFDYPPLDAVEDTQSQPVHDEALTDYPVSYLDDGRASPPRHQVMEEQTAEKPAAVELGTNSWATMNHLSNATAMPPTDRLGSRDGSTSEQALIIDESDSDSESSPEPMAVEDTLNNGRAYALDMYEDAEAEDEVDAQYSDDDEPEYDADEMGGDYDTRNYERPADDDDGGYDEDPRSRRLEPEFEEGESWDEEEQEEFLDEEEESEYELDEDMPDPHPPPVVRANPIVIDLISSSEDESEDEDEDEDAGEGGATAGIQGSGAHIDSRISPSPPKIISEADSRQLHLDDDDSEIVSQASMSEADSSLEAGAEDNGYTSSYRQEEVEDGGDPDDLDEEDVDDKDNGDAEERDHQEGMGQTMEPVPYERREEEEVYTSEHQTEHQTKLYPEQETDVGCETKPEGDATLLGGAENENDTTVSHQIIASQTEMLGSAVTEDRREEDAKDAGNVGNNTGAEPLWLEMLHRAVDREPGARSHGLLAEQPVETVVVETLSDEQPWTELSEQDDVQMQYLLDSQLDVAPEAAPKEVSKQDERENQADQLPFSKSDTEYPPQFVIDRREASAVTSSSPPPLTQSSQSGWPMEGDDKSMIKGTTVPSTDPIATAQLPTPLDTQITENTFNTSTHTHMTMAESFGSFTTVEQEEYKTMEVSVTEKSIGTTAQQDANMVEDGNTSTASSPAPSFRTQAGDGEERQAWYDSEEEQMKIDSQLNQGLSPDPVTYELNTGESFASHMDIDEELQASILEHSLLEEYNDDELEEHNNDDNAQDALNEPIQFGDTDEAFWESEPTGEADITPSSLHENTPAKQLAEEISTQLRRNFATISSSASDEDSDTSMLKDPSVRLARVTNASKKRANNKRASTGRLHFPRRRTLHFPRRRTLDLRRSPTPDTDNSSLQLARASLSSQTPKSDEDSPSMTAAKLQLSRHLRDELPDFCLLEFLRQHVTKSLDVIAVAAMQPPKPRRAKGGPREYMLSFTISDYSIGPHHVAEAFIYRPHQESLPVVKYGDVVLFRNFTVVSLAGKGYGLRSNDGSSWAVFDYEDEPAQIRGPPVEYIQREIAYVNYLREWFNLLDAKARARLERATQDLISAGGKSK
ncbi:hypothetical protein F4860DRAFT_510294 [Xylaria cubensis]|nr:hypothetical protein F4860DRAFT_510294 [Xylaria cubensis]